jgi:hypothetical protein
MKLPLFLMVFVNVYIHFRISTRIRNPRVTDPDPAKVPDPCGSGSTTLIPILYISLLYTNRQFRYIPTAFMLLY